MSAKEPKDGRIPPWIYETKGPPDPEGRLREIVSEDRNERSRSADREVYCEKCAEEYPESKGKPNPTFLDGQCALHGRQVKRRGK